MCAHVVPNPESAGVATFVKLVRAYWLWPVVAGVAGMLFFSASGAYEETARGVLHGLCAQTPSHTISLGGVPLPFDARMTGIYAGFIVTIGVLAYRRTFLCYGAMSKPVCAVIALLVLTMAIDGFTSLLTDLRLWHPYETTNSTRVVTGYGSGMALAIGLSWLMASTMWRMSSARPPISSVREFITPVLGLAPYGVLLALQPGWARFPVTLMLVISAWLTVSMLMLVIILLVTRLDDRVRGLSHLHVPIATAGILGMVTMLTLAGMRFWAEHTFGLSNAMM